MVEVSVSDFREMLFQFSDEEQYPDNMINSFLLQAKGFIQNENGHYVCISDDVRKQAIIYVSAHLLALYQMLTGNGANATGATGGTGQILSTTVGNVSVALVPPPNGSKQYYYWYNQTPYGQMYLNLLRSKMPAGGFFGGSNQRVFVGNNR